MKPFPPIPAINWLEVSHMSHADAVQFYQDLQEARSVRALQSDWPSYDRLQGCCNAMAVYLAALFCANIETAKGGAR